MQFSFITNIELIHMTKHLSLISQRKELQIIQHGGYSEIIIEAL